MRKTNSIFWGLVLILIGLLVILVQTNILNIGDIFENFNWIYLWPAILIFIGISFHVQFFAGKRHNPGLLVPGGILLVYGCLFFYLRISGWNSIGNLWPMFLVGPGFGLFELKLFSRGRQGSWIPVIILFSLATFFLIRENFSNSAVAVAIALIIIGIVVIVLAFVDNMKKKNNKGDVHVDVE